MKIIFIVLAILALSTQINSQKVNLTFYPYYKFTEEVEKSDHHESEIYIIKEGQVLDNFGKMLKEKNLDISQGKGYGEYASFVSTYSQITKFRIFVEGKKNDEYKPEIKIIKNQKHLEYMLISAEKLEQEYNFKQKTYKDEQDGYYFYIQWENPLDLEQNFGLYNIELKMDDEDHTFSIQKKYEKLDKNEHFYMKYYDEGTDETLKIKDFEQPYQIIGNRFEVLFSVNEGAQIIEDAYLYEQDDNYKPLPDFVVNQYQDLTHRFTLECAKNQGSISTGFRFQLYGYKQIVEVIFERNCENQSSEQVQEEINEVGDGEQKQGEGLNTQKIKEDKNDKKHQKRPKWANTDAHKTIKEDNRTKNVNSWDTTTVRQGDSNHYIRIKKGRCKKMKKGQQSNDFMIVQKGKINPDWQKKPENEYESENDLAHFCIENTDLAKQNGNIYFKPVIKVNSEETKEFFDPKVTVKSFRNKENNLIGKGYYELKNQSHSQINIDFNCLKEEQSLQLTLEIYSVLTDQNYDSKTNKLLRLPIVKNCDIPEEYEQYSTGDTIESLVFYFLCAIGLFIGYKSVMCLKNMIKADNDVHEQAELQKTKRKYDNIDQLPDSSIVFRN